MHRARAGALQKWAVFIAMSCLAGSTTACGAGAMKSASPVRGDFESDGRRAESAPSPAQAERPMPTDDQMAGRETMLISAKYAPGVQSADEPDDDRIADNRPSASPPAPPPSTHVNLPATGGAGGASGVAVQKAPASAAQAVTGAAIGVRGPAVPRGATTPPQLPPPAGNSSQQSLPKGPSAPEAPNKQQLLVYTAHLQMAVYLVEPGLVAVEKIAKDFGGYLASRGDNKIEIRVPRERFNEALKAVEGTGDVLHRDVQASDVTDQYVDMESRLRNAKVIRARLQALLERAAVKEALEIERELGRVSQEIEVLEGKLKLLRDKVAFSTITVQYAPKAQALQKTAFALPFPWLSQLGLPNLLRLRDHKGDD